MKKETVIYLSSNGRSRISAKLFLPEDDVPVKGMVQISHGMCEYVGRYEQLAQYLCDRGYAVCGNDHLGHKNTALLNRERLGYFGNVGSWSYLVEDLELLRPKSLLPAFPGCPGICWGTAWLFYRPDVPSRFRHEHHRTDSQRYSRHHSRRTGR